VAATLCILLRKTGGAAGVCIVVIAALSTTFMMHFAAVILLRCWPPVVYAMIVVGSLRRYLLLLSSSFDVSELLCQRQGLYLAVLALCLAVVRSTALVALSVSSRCCATLACRLALVLRSWVLDACW
jgi:hypothetical protein